MWRDWDEQDRQACRRGGGRLGIRSSLSAAAQELKIGIKTEPSSLDPQFHTLNPNIQVAQHFFDALVQQDENLKPQPALALSWKPVDDTTWEIQAAPEREVP